MQIVECEKKDVLQTNHKRKQLCSAVNNVDTIFRIIFTETSTYAC